MNEVARNQLTPIEIEQKLEYLIDQYTQHMKLHNLKTKSGILQTMVTSTAEFLGDVASFRWGKATKALFFLTKQRISLLEGELTAPGKEVAYLVKAQETF